MHVLNKMLKHRRLIEILRLCLFDGMIWVEREMHRKSSNILDIGIGRRFDLKIPANSQGKRPQNRCKYLLSSLCKLNSLCADSETHDNV